MKQQCSILLSHYSLQISPLQTSSLEIFYGSYGSLRGPGIVIHVESQTSRGAISPNVSFPHHNKRVDDFGEAVIMASRMPLLGDPPMLSGFARSGFSKFGH